MLKEMPLDVSRVAFGDFSLEIIKSPDTRPTEPIQQNQALNQPTKPSPNRATDTCLLVLGRGCGNEPRDSL